MWQRRFHSCVLHHIARTRNKQANRLANIGEAKAQVPPGVFFRHINHRSIRRWHPQVTREIKIFGQKSDQEDPPSKKNQAMTNQVRTCTSRLVNPNHITTMFSQGVPNSVIISDSREMQEQDAKGTMPQEAFTAMCITLPGKDAFHGEPRIFRLQKPKRSYETKYKPKMLQHQEEAYSSKSKAN